MPSSRLTTATPTWSIFTSRRRVRGGRTSISIPPFAALAPQLARPDLGLELRRRLVAFVTRGPVHVQPRVVGHVEAAEIAQAKRTKRPVQALLHRDIDVFERSNSSVKQPVRLLRRRMEDPVH